MKKYMTSRSSATINLIICFVITTMISCIQTNASSVNVDRNQDYNNDNIYKIENLNGYFDSLEYFGIQIAGGPRSKTEGDIKVTLEQSLFQNKTWKLIITNEKNKTAGADFVFSKVKGRPIFLVIWHDKNRPQTEIWFNNIKDKGKFNEICAAARLLVKSVEVLALPAYTKIISMFVGAIKVPDHDVKLIHDLEIDHELFLTTREYYTGVDSTKNNDECTVIIDKGAKGDVFRVNMKRGSGYIRGAFLFLGIPIWPFIDSKCINIDIGWQNNRKHTIATSAPGSSNNVAALNANDAWALMDGNALAFECGVNKRSIRICNDNAHASSSEIKITHVMYMFQWVSAENINISCNNISLKEVQKVRE